MEQRSSLGSSYERPVFVLIHSPFLGPTSWLQVAQEFEHRGYCAVVPSLRGLADAAGAQWRYAVSAVRAATSGTDAPLVLVAHGDACRMLPAIGRAVSREVLGLMFVDGCLPPEVGPGRLASEKFVERVRSLIHDGADPRASWFRHELPRGKAGDDAVRALMHERAPRLPLSYFHDRVPMPQDWTQGHCAYLCLSDETGGESAARARSYGWPVAAIRGAHHLSIVTDPEAVTAVLLDLAGVLNTPISHQNTKVSLVPVAARRGRLSATYR